MISTFRILLAIQGEHDRKTVYDAIVGACPQAEIIETDSLSGILRAYSETEIAMTVVDTSYCQVPTSWQNVFATG